jgi:hypothetical protein
MNSGILAQSRRRRQNDGATGQTRKFMSISTISMLQLALQPAAVVSEIPLLIDDWSR